MKTALFDFHLPPELIAQEPAAKRDQSRLLVLHRDTGKIEHRTFADVLEYIRPDDVLVVNDTRVIKARIQGHRTSGGRVEVLLVRRAQGISAAWEAMLNCRGKLRDGETVTFGEGITGTLLGRDGKGTSIIRLEPDAEVEAKLEIIGNMPLPPYIKRMKERDPHASLDAERYQTVYAREPGAVAAPTAGLHFTPGLLAKIRKKGCNTAAITLHVGPGTFKPVTADEVENHAVDPEYYTVTQAAADAVNSSARTIAVGTTSCRTLESAVNDGGKISAASGWTKLFIRPPYEFRAVDALITNFHLPKSSLLMLVSAFAGRERILAAYEEAVSENYRFYSYGDAMLII